MRGLLSRFGFGAYRKDLGSLESVPKSVTVKHFPLYAISRFAEDSRLGKTHYFIKGPENGHRVVLVHGISGSWASMPQVVEYLSTRGFRVLAYDLYGRGYSSAPNVKYTGDLYAKQLHFLMHQVAWKDAHILGYSLGGAIATQFTDMFPEQVKDLVLIAPAGLRKSVPFGAIPLFIPIFGPLLAYMFGRRFLSWKSADNHSVAFKDSPHMKHFIAVQNLNILRNPGFLHAYISTVKYGPIYSMQSTYRRVGDTLKDSILCVWGRNDKVVNFERESPVLRLCMPCAKFIAMDGGHSILPEECDKVLRPVVDFLLRNEGLT